ncbi:hypothetical protein EV127DRAFT_477269 [Xylaria flabelliformis]|nr:hypothetical protein EV127DRAFT_477269 [Xylaria flabelliformis]
MSIKSSDVYVGWWTNWSKGNSILGATITLPSSSASLLISFLAVFLSITASHLWRLTAYVIHYYRHDVDQIKSRALRRQQQVVFKSNMTAISTALLLSKMMWVNRSKPTAFKDSCLPILISTACATLGIALSLISSKIISTSSSLEVLRIAHKCISPDIFNSDVSSIDNLQMVGSQLTDIVKLSTTYSQRCYNATNNEECRPFVTKIQWTTDWKVACPFNETMCLSTAMQLDTGLLNSNAILGVNSPAKDQIELRKITTCAPIAHKNYTRSVNVTNGLAGEKRIAYTYGWTPYLKESNSENNITLIFNEYLANSSGYYKIDLHYFSRNNDGVNDFHPISELDNAGGNVVLVLIGSGLKTVHTKQCDDPVFAAHVPEPIFNTSQYIYHPDQLAGAIGCVEQIQICNPNGNHNCTSLGGPADPFREASLGLSFNTIQNATLNLLTQRLISLYWIGGDDSNLLANQQLIVKTLYSPLPSNQWQIEVQGWHATAMAALQYSLLSRISDAYLEYNSSSSTLTSPEDLAICSRQRARISAGFANVSALNLIIVLSLGTAVIVTNLCLDLLVELLAKFFPTVKPKQVTWIRNDVLHLQRLAYTAQELLAGEDRTAWTGINKSIPRVENKALLGSLVEHEEEQVALEPRAGKTLKGHS